MKKGGHDERQAARYAKAHPPRGVGGVSATAATRVRALWFLRLLEKVTARHRGDLKPGRGHVGATTSPGAEVMRGNSQRKNVRRLLTPLCR